MILTKNYKFEVLGEELLFQTIADKLVRRFRKDRKRDIDVIKEV